MYIFRLPYNHLNNNNIHFSTKIAKGSSFKHCIIGKNNYIACRGSFYNANIGNYCCIGPNVHIGGMQHSYWWYSMSPLVSSYCKEPNLTRIGNDVWIGAGCIIKEGVSIGDGAVIGANSFVNKDVEKFSIVVGSPAHHLKYRFDDKTINKIISSNYWNESPTVAKKILNNLV